MAVAWAKPGLHVNHGRRGGWSTGSPPLALSLAVKKKRHLDLVGTVGLILGRNIGGKRWIFFEGREMLILPVDE